MMSVSAHLYVCIIVCFLLNVTPVDTQWEGLFNAARGRHTLQSSEYATCCSSDRAVDGCLDGNLDNNCCTHTQNTAKTWWSVDLGQNYTIREVILYNRDRFRHRLQDLKIFSSFISGRPSESHDKVQCAKRDYEFREFVNLSCVTTARYILIEKEIPEHWGAGYFALTLCEVQVLAECLDGNYGIDCKKNCSSHCKDGAVCVKKDGSCPHGQCSAGYQGSKCDQNCEDGTYGENCKGRCSEFCAETCDKFSHTGSCSGNCMAGYMGDNCTEECKPGFYGDNCEMKCRCHHDNCNHTHGCMGGCLDGWEGDGCLQQVVDKGGSAVYGSVAAVLVIVVLIAVIVAIIFCRRRKRRRHPQKTESIHEEEMDFFSKPDARGPEANQNGVANQTIPDDNENGFTADTEAGYESQISEEEEMDVDSVNVYMNVNADESKSKTKIKPENLTQYIDKQKTDIYPFKQEYETIPKQTSLWQYATAPELKGKNRYKNILPYDYNRVVLSKLRGDQYSDYINASLIKDYSGQIAYIAALGVTKTTMSDFWRMIWEQDVSTIVMVTNLYEEGKIKCDQYWPRDKQATIGPFTVYLNVEQIKPGYVRRKMTVSKDGKSRKVSQYHYTDWPDKREPSNLRTLLAVREVMRTERMKRTSPILVHCSAGVGRTGTMIALDILLDQLEREKAVDIRQCVVKLRKERTNMVQTLTQYIFLYEAMEQTVNIGDAALSCQNLKAVVKKDWLIPYQKQFEFLERRKPKFEDTDLEFGRIDNKEKNRDLSVIPAYYKRAKIPSQPEVYVNAVLVKGYSIGCKYIVTQIPLQNTVTDFWTLVTEHKSSVIVCLQSDQAQKHWLPGAESSLPCGKFTVKLKTYTKGEDWTEYDIFVYWQDSVPDTEYANVGNTEAQHRVKVLAVNGSRLSMEHRETTVTFFGKIYNKMNRLRQSSKHKMVTVMCLNGSTESGMFVAGSYLMEMSQEEDQVDVFHTVKHIRINRPQFVHSLDQYKFLHKLPAGNVVGNSPDSDYYNL